MGGEDIVCRMSSFSKLTPQERKSQLDAWEAGRKTERSHVVLTMWMTFPTCLIVASLTYWIATRFIKGMSADALATAVGVFPLWLWLARYLQTWGSFIERRIEDIEAKIDGRSPEYYISENHAKFSEQPLHAKLEAIEHLLNGETGGTSKT